MSSFETSEAVSTRSVLRHRPISTQPVLMRKRSVITSATIPAVRRASRPRYPDTGDDSALWQRGDEIVNDERETYPPVQTQPGARRVTAGRVPQTPPLKALLAGERNVWGTRYRAHPLLYLGIGMLTMLVLWVLLSAALGWFNTTLDDMRYGRPRTFQTDAWVGHNEQNGVPSHFIALNLNGHIEIIEFPAGDATHAHVYMGPQLYGANSDLVPVTLKFIDVNGDQKADMVVTFQGSQAIFINDQGAFRALQPSERRQVEQFLQHVNH